MNILLGFVLALASLSTTAARMPGVNAPPTITVQPVAREYLPVVNDTATNSLVDWSQEVKSVVRNAWAILDAEYTGSSVIKNVTEIQECHNFCKATKNCRSYYFGTTAACYEVPRDKRRTCYLFSREVRDTLLTPESDLLLFPNGRVCPTCTVGFRGNGDTFNIINANPWWLNIKVSEDPGYTYVVGSDVVEGDIAAITAKAPHINAAYLTKSAWNCQEGCRLSAQCKTFGFNPKTATTNACEFFGRTFTTFKELNDNYVKLPLVKVAAPFGGFAVNLKESAWKAGDQCNAAQYKQFLGNLKAYEGCVRKPANAQSFLKSGSGVCSTELQKLNANCAIPPTPAIQEEMQQMLCDVVSQ